MIDEATTQTSELINEHEIMQQAYAQANEVVQQATRQAQEILDNATQEANAMKESVIQYTDSLLASLGDIIATSMQVATDRYGELVQSLNDCYEVVKANRTELNPLAEIQEDMEFVENNTDMNVGEQME